MHSSQNHLEGTESRRTPTQVPWYQRWQRSQSSMKVLVMWGRLQMQRVSSEKVRLVLAGLVLVGSEEEAITLADLTDGSSGRWSGSVRSATRHPANSLETLPRTSNATVRYPCSSAASPILYWNRWFWMCLAMRLVRVGAEGKRGWVWTVRRSVMRLRRTTLKGLAVEKSVFLLRRERSWRTKKSEMAWKGARPPLGEEGWEKEDWRRKRRVAVETWMWEAVEVRRAEVDEEEEEEEEEEEPPPSSSNMDSTFEGDAASSPPEEAAAPALPALPAWL